MSSGVQNKCYLHISDSSGHSEVSNSNTFLLFVSLMCMFSYANTYNRVLKVSIDQPMLVSVSHCSQ